MAGTVEREAWVGGTWHSALLAVVVASAIPVGVMALLAVNERRVRAALPHLVAFGAGALVGGAAFHLVPEALARTRAPGFVAAMVVGGYAAFLVVERWLHTRGGHRHDDPATPHAMGVVPPGGARRVVVGFNLFGDGLHNLIDGMLIGASFLADPSLGVVTAVAVSLHELPRELGTFCIFVHAGVPVRTAMAYNLSTAVVAVAGTLFTLAAGTRVAPLASALLPFAAGNFVYLAAAVLGPALRRPVPGRARLAWAGALVLGLAVTGMSALAV